MTPKEYSQMMAYLARPAMADGGRIGFKKKGFVNKVGKAGGDAEFQRNLQIAYDTYGKDALDKGAKVLGFKDYKSMGGSKNLNFRKKIKNEIIKYGEVLPRYEADVRGRKTRIIKEQGIQIKLIEATNQNKFFDPKAFAKKNNISLKKVKEEAKKLQRNIYKKRIVEASRAIGKETKEKLDWIPNDPKFSDNALNKLWKSKLIKYERKIIDELFFDAFGRKTSDTYNPKKFLAIKKNLNEYRQLREAINAKYPNINFELDHPLSKSSLNKLFNATTDQLTRVNVLEADLNNGFKDSLSRQYEKAVQSNNLKKKKAVEKIARDLKLNIGKISDDATNFKYGVKEFQKLNIKDEIAKSLENLQFLNKNFQDYAKKNPELFKTAGVRTKQTFTQISPSEIKGIENIIASFGDGSCDVQFGKIKNKKDGGRIGYATGPASLSSCLESGVKNLNEGKFKTTDQVQDAARLLGGGKNVLRGLFKYGVLPEAAFVASESLFRTALGEKPFNAVKKSIDSFTFGLTDFTSGIEAKKFGKDADKKLAVDKFRNSQALVDSLQKKLTNLKSITDQAGEGYVGDLTSDIQMTQAQLKSAKNELQKNTVSSDIVQFIDRKALDIADAQTAKSDFAKQSLKDQMEGIPGIRDYTDTESIRIFPKQPSQMDLNLKMLPQMPTDLFTATPSGIEDYAKQLKRLGVDASPRDVEAYRDLLKSMSLSESADAFSPEQVYGASGVFSQPLAGGGIAKLAGVDSGPPPASGPNSQGLPGLLKRVRNL